MSHPKYVLTISGSDSSGGAGMQADNRAILASGAYPLNVITAVTLQTPEGVESVDLMSPTSVKQQLQRLLDCYPVAAIKSGMLGSSDIASVVADVLEDVPAIPYVLDPVLVSSSGRRLLDAAGKGVLRERLMPRATLSTPNLDELFELQGNDDVARLVHLAEDLAEQLGQAILLKGGHLPGDYCEDWLVEADGRLELFSSERVASVNLRGTGCALSAAIAAQLARGQSLLASVQLARELLYRSVLQQAGKVWVGEGPSFLSEA